MQDLQERLRHNKRLEYYMKALEYNYKMGKVPEGKERFIRTAIDNLKYAVEHEF